MSYDIWLTIDTGGPELAVVSDWNFTSNSAGMWRAAGADLAEFAGKLAGDCAPILAAAIVELERAPDNYRALEPSNGWGTYDQLIPALRELSTIFNANPRATVAVGR